jgi:hypothetical protein
MTFGRASSWRSVIGVLGIGASLTGCASQRNALEAQSRVNPVSTAAYPQKFCPLVMASGSDTRMGAINLDCFAFPEVDARYDREEGRTPHYGISDRRNLAYAMAAKNSIYRNRLTSILIKQSDDICVQELGRLTANEATVNTTLSILGTGFSTAASIVSGDLAKSILAGGATLAGASRDHINVHVYRNTIAQAISQVIWSERQLRQADIQKHYGQALEAWSIDDAIRDVNAYHAQCSFYKGLELLLKAANNNSDVSAYRRELVRRAELSRTREAILGVEQSLKQLPVDSAEAAVLRQEVVRLTLKSLVGPGGEKDGSGDADVTK